MCASIFFQTNTLQNRVQLFVSRQILVQNRVQIFVSDKQRVFAAAHKYHLYLLNGVVYTDERSATSRSLRALGAADICHLSF